MGRIRLCTERYPYVLTVCPVSETRDIPNLLFRLFCWCRSEVKGPKPGCRIKLSSQKCDLNAERMVDIECHIGYRNFQKVNVRRSMLWGKQQNVQMADRTISAS